MSLKRVKTSNGPALDDDIRLGLAPDGALAPATLVMRFYADALLRRMLSPEPPVRKTRIDELSPHILKDIGWPPE